MVALCSQLATSLYAQGKVEELKFSKHLQSVAGKKEDAILSNIVNSAANYFRGHTRFRFANDTTLFGDRVTMIEQTFATDLSWPGSTEQLITIATTLHDDKIATQVYSLEFQFEGGSNLTKAKMLYKRIYDQINWTRIKFTSGKSLILNEPLKDLITIGPGKQKGSVFFKQLSDSDHIILSLEFITNDDKIYSIAINFLKQRFNNKDM